MADTWQNPPASGNPPANNTDVGTDPAWQQYIKDHSDQYLKDFQKDPKYQQKLSPRIESKYFTSTVELPISGEDPSKWTESGKKVAGSENYTIWERTYPSLTYQKYQRLDIYYSITYYAGFFGMDELEVINYRVDGPFFFPQGAPIVKSKVRTYVVWRSSHATDEKKITITVAPKVKLPFGDAELGGSAQTTVTVTGPGSVVITSPPPDDKPPLPGTKYGDPHRELENVDAPLIQEDDGAILMRLPVRVLNGADGKPLMGALLEVNGSPGGSLSERGELILEVYLPRSSQVIGTIGIPQPTKAPAEPE